MDGVGVQAPGRFDEGRLEAASRSEERFELSPSRVQDLEARAVRSRQFEAGRVIPGVGVRHVRLGAELAWPPGSEREAQGRVVSGRQAQRTMPQALVLEEELQFRGQRLFRIVAGLHLDAPRAGLARVGGGAERQNADGVLGRARFQITQPEGGAQPDRLLGDPARTHIDHFARDGGGRSPVRARGRSKPQRSQGQVARRVQIEFRPAGLGGPQRVQELRPVPRERHADGRGAVRFDQQDRVALRNPLEVGPCERLRFVDQAAASLARLRHHRGSVQQDDAVPHVARQRAGPRVGDREQQEQEGRQLQQQRQGMLDPAVPLAHGRGGPAGPEPQGRDQHVPARAVIEVQTDQERRQRQEKAQKLAQR